MAQPGTHLLSLAILLLAIGACAEGSDGGSVPTGADAGPEFTDAAVPDAAPPACESEPCFPGVECAENAGSYDCGPCPAGLDGDGETCTEIDGCETSPCFLGVPCNDVPAPGEGATCGECPDGFFGNGIVCTDIDACEGDPCFPGVTCVDNAPPEDGFTCGTCPTGFEGDGLLCTDIDECANTPCFGDVICTDAVAPQTGFSCGNCPPGTTGDGVDCDLLCEPVSSLACGGQLSGSNDGAGSADIVDNWACSPFTHTGPEIVYSFTPDATGTATVRLSGLSADLDLMVIEDSSLGGLCDPADLGVCVPGGTSSGAGLADEEVRFAATIGTTYYFIVDGFAEATSSFSLHVRTATEEFLISEVSYGITDFVEVRNHGACSADFAGLGILHKASLTAEPHVFTFPIGSNVAAGGVLRWIETSGGPFLSNEIDAGVSILDIPADAGSTALCNGACNTVDCSNLLDYVERDDDTGDGFLPGGPSCATLAGGPIDSAGQLGEISLHRTSAAGSGGPFQASNWAFAVTTRD